MMEQVEPVVLSDAGRVIGQLRDELTLTREFAIELGAASIFSERVNDRLTEATRRLETDTAKFNEEAEPPNEAVIEMGVSSLREFAVELANTIPLMRGEASSGPQSDSREALREWETLARTVQTQVAIWRTTLLTRTALMSAEDAARRSTSSAAAAAQAAGLSGASELESSFQNYADGERNLARWFRRSTIGVLCLVAAAGVVSIVVPVALGQGATTDWQQVLYRLAVLSALAALAAYLGRQSSHHRRSTVWADAIAVQLRAFPAFAKPITNEELRNDLYGQLGRRVLGSAPDFTSKSDDVVSIDVASLIDALIKQARAN